MPVYFAGGCLVYMVRFGMISWLPIYLLTVKHFSKEQMSVAFRVGGDSSTLLAGWPSDKLFKRAAECR